MAFKVRFINKSKYRKSGILPGIASLLLSLFLLSGCFPFFDGVCFDADDWGDVVQKTVVVKAKDQFTSAGINLSAGNQLDIAISGAVNLCPDDITLSANNLSAANSGWQDSGIDVSVDDKDFFIAVQGDYTDSSNTAQTQGHGLYAYILPRDGSGDSIATANSKMWYGAPLPASGVLPASNNNRPNIDGTCTGKCNFFELYDSRTGTGGYHGSPPASGRLYFRYARTASAPGVGNNGDGDSRYSPWHGQYKWNGSCDACRQTTIFATCTAAAVAAAAVAGALTFGAGAGPAYAATFGTCQFAWQTSCGVAKNLELFPDMQKSTNSNCQEHENGDGGVYSGPGGYWGSDVKDHWINENYDDTHYNQGGYTITVSKGCMGTAGKYLQMNVIQPGSYNYINTDLVPTADTPCPDGYDATKVAGKCINNLDNSVAFTSTPNMTHQTCAEGEWCDMNSSGYNASGDPIDLPLAFTNPHSVNGVQYYGRQSFYSNPAPANGELWFEILDSATEKNTAHPAGGYYPDNLGQYTLNIKTKNQYPYTQILNMLIQPLKKIISGYCVSGYNPNTPSASLAIENVTEVQCTSTMETVGVLNTDPMVAGDYKKTNGITYDTATQPKKWKPGITQFMYKKLLDPDNSTFVSAVRAAMVLLVVVYAMLFMMGMIKEVQSHFIIRVVRAAVVIQLVSPNSWEFFNSYLFTFFIDGMNQLIGIIAGDFMGIASHAGMEPTTLTNPFAFADITLEKFLSPVTWIKIFGLFFSSLIGPVYVILIIVGMFYFVIALLKATIIYILSMLAISLLLILAPIFISFLLFDFTKPYFTKWIHTLLSYLFQPVLVFTALAIFNIFFYSAIYTLLHYRVCWEPIFFLNIIGIPIPIFFFFAPDTGYTPYGGIPMGLFMILIFIIIANLMVKMVDFMSELAAHLTTLDRSSTVAAAANQIAAKFSAMAMGGLKEVLNPRNIASVIRNPMKAMRNAESKSTAKIANKLNDKFGANAVRSALGMKKANPYKADDFKSRSDKRPK